MTRTLCLCLIVSSTGLQAQSIVGSWTLDPLAPLCRGRAGGAGGLVGGCGEDGGAKIICGDGLSIEISADMIRLQRTVSGEALKMAFPLDGSPTKHPLPSCQNRRKEIDDLMKEQIIATIGALALKGVEVEVGSDDMTTTAVREGNDVVLRSRNTSLVMKGVLPTLVVEQTQKISPSGVGGLLVETDKTATVRPADANRPAQVTTIKSRVVYARRKLPR